MSKRAYQLNQDIAEFVKNKAAIGTPYTQEDIAFVNQYIGYGGMWNYDDDLAKERGLYEYYTPIELVAKMVGLAKKHGYATGPVLEPSCGVGRFLHYFSPDESVTGIELDEISYLIAKANFPSYDIRHQSFNSLFVDRRGNAQSFKPTYKLVIGNPPYGAFAGRGTSYEKGVTKARTYVDYFITRGLDLTLSGGLLIYIIPSSFLENEPAEVHERILDKSDLVDAYRLPVNVFSQTDIQTDIVVFKKK